MFEEIGYIAATAIIGCLSGVLATYFMGKHIISDDKIMDKIDMILTNVVSDTEMQKKLYSVGILLGSGIAKGTGLQGGGKFKFTDILGRGLMGFIDNFMGNKEQQQQEPSQEIVPTEQQWKPKKW